MNNEHSSHPLRTHPTKPIISVRNLKKYFPVKKGLLIKRVTGSIKAVDDVSFDVQAGETLGVVGESGCGKSTLGRTLLRLYEPTGGEILIDGIDLASLKPQELVKQRKSMQMIFQDPYASINPRLTVASIIAEPLRIHRGLSGTETRDRVAELMRLVELNPKFLNRYPHEFSGGQRQRIGIARALALNPKVVICDEPISALDVSIQAQVINLLGELQQRLGLTYVFISHDLSMVRHISTRIAVMYLGRIVEIADRKSLFAAPRHPYSQALLSAVCVPDPKRSNSNEIILEGDPPNPARPPSGCRFNTRCPFAFERCLREEPELTPRADGHLAACHLERTTLEDFKGRFSE
ncbi:ABC transporter ATP-binding protein [Microvirga pudoricolor]|uniref:ABC transporter ATP-binding protein n=1 Tax=Microvirga pudoricolor TaxID=2778729 RepID=UPI001951D6B3|nr:dipeptide ABC transporter ATP-binding protein [Microvirga pudoricolor]MBM6596301.1 dipeptide ABC transporter ATP-binding protein [Microvirga pudoricolor]